MTINLKDLLKHALEEAPGDDLEGYALFAVAEGGTIVCNIIGEAATIKGMLCNVLERDTPRALFEECYAAVLAKRAGMKSDNESANFNNN